MQNNGQQVIYDRTLKANVFTIAQRFANFEYYVSQVRWLQDEVQMVIELASCARCPATFLSLPTFSPHPIKRFPSCSRILPGARPEMLPQGDSLTAPGLKMQKLAGA